MDELGIHTHISRLRSSHDISAFLLALWRTLLSMLRPQAELDPSLLSQLTHFFTATLCPLEKMSRAEAEGLLSAVMGHLSDVNDSGNSGGALPQELAKTLKAVVIRFADVFDPIRLEWTARDKKVVERMMLECAIQGHEVSVWRTLGRRGEGCRVPGRDEECHGFLKFQILKIPTSPLF